MAHIDDLPPELLGRILRPFSPDELLMRVQWVSRTWRQVAALPQLWSCVLLDLREKQVSFGPDQQRFFAARAAGIETLALLLPATDPSFLSRALECLRGRAHLKSLCVAFNGMAMDAQSQAAAALALLDSKLEVLCLHGLWGRQWEESLSRVGLFADSLRVLHLHYEAPLNGGAQNTFSAFQDQLLGLAACLEELMISGKGAYLEGDTLPPSVGGLTRLTSLSFIQAGGGRVPEQWQALTGLQVLRVITAIGKELHLPNLSMLTRLAVVDLGCRNIPTSLAALPNLTHLTLRGLLVTPDGAGALEDLVLAQEYVALERLLGDSRLALESLSLRNCDLYELPDSVAQRTSLRTLAITNTHVWRLPSEHLSLRSLEKLRHLDLTANCFCHVPLQALTAPQLQTLSLVAGEAAWNVAAARQGSMAAFAAELAEVQAALEQWWTEGIEDGELEIYRDGTTDCINRAVNKTFVGDLVLEWVTSQGGAAWGVDAGPERPQPFVAQRFLPLVYRVREEDVRPKLYDP